MNNKITVLPNFLINWLEDSGFEFYNIGGILGGGLTYRKGKEELYIDPYYDGGTAITRTGRLGTVHISNETTEEEFLRWI